MEYRLLGSTGLRLSAIGLGTWAMGGRWWGPTDDPASIATIQAALDKGINFFDTADVYGFGRSEQILGKALAKKRADVIIASKVGLRWNNKGQVRHDLSRKHIAKAVTDSLQRLQTDYIDLYQLHWPDPNTPVEETAAALQECVDSGKVRFLGVSNLSPEQLTEYRNLIRVESLQPPLNLFERHAEVRMLPICLKENIGVLIYSPLCRGLLTGRFRPNQVFKETVRKRDPLFNGDVFARNLAIVDELQKMAGEHDKTVSQLAIAWVLAHPAVSSALCGGRRPEQVIENVGAVHWSLDEHELKRIDQILMQTPG